MLIALILLGALLRLLNLGGKSMWLDEAFSAANAALTQAEIWARVSEPHPPLYYSLLHAWRAAGDGDAWLRLPSVLTSWLNLGLMFLLARRLLGREAALLATALLALSPLDLWYAQEARMYIFVTTCGLLAALGLASLRPWGMLLAAGALALGLYVDYLMVPLWVGISALWLVYWWGEGHRPLPLLGWLLGAIAAVAAYQPWWDAFLGIINRLGTIFVFARLGEALGVPALAARDYFLLLGAIGVLLVAAAAFGRRLLRVPALADGLRWPLVAGLALGILLTPFPRLYSVKRILVTGWPLLLLAAVWFVGRWRPPRRAQIAGALLAVSLAATLAAVWVPKDDWRGAVAHIEARAAAGELVMVDPVWEDISYGRYAPDRPVQTFGSLEEILADPPAGLWLVATRFPGEPIPSSPLEARLDAAWALVDEWSFYRLAVRYYRPAE